MAYVISEPCIGTKDNSCVEVCPVDCIHPTPDEPDYEQPSSSTSIRTSASIATPASRPARSTRSPPRTRCRREWHQLHRDQRRLLPRRTGVISGSASVPLIALHVLATSIWVGGFVAILVVARVAGSTLEPAQRVAFFRALGRSYAVVGGLALLIAIGSGAALLAGHPRSPQLIAAGIVAAALLITTAVGVAQARAMTRLRRRALTAGRGASLDRQVQRGAALATALRATIGILTLALVVLGASLAG